MTLTIIAALALAVWLYLILLHGRFWRADTRLPDIDAERRDWPAVVAVVPARDEADVIARAVTSLVGQDYPGSLRAIVVDDASTDGTGEVAGRAAQGIEVVRAASRPAGWTGKLWAMQEGVRRAAPDAPFVWFTDADIEHAPDELRRMVCHALAGERDLVSLMVRLHCETAWERLLIPAFVFFFQMLYPFPRVNDRDVRIAAAAGGSMLVRRGALERIGGLVTISDALIDDCALARALKNNGAIWLGLSETTRSIRPYGGLAGMWSMVARTAFHQLRYSPVLLAGTLVGLALIYLVPPLALLGLPLHGGALAAGLGAAAWLLMALAYAPTLRLYGQPIPAALLLPVAALFYALMTGDSARRHWQGRGGAWKTRHHAPGRGTVG